MDYINLPRELIFKDRDNLKDFEVNNKNSLNYYLFLKLKEMPIMYMERALDTALRCFNNAYYICTLIQLEDFPEIRVADYENILLKDKSIYVDDICSAAMAMVCILLPAYDKRWRQEDNDLIKAINYRFTNYRWIHSEYCKRFENMVGSISPSTFILNKGEFAPRDIIEVINTFSEKDLQVYAEYICERLAQLEDFRQQMLGFNTAILRIEEYQRTLCEDSEYNPKKDSFKYSNYEGMSIIRDFSFEDRVRNYYKKSKETIRLYKEHLSKVKNCHHEQQTDSAPTIPGNAELVAENEQLRQQLAQRTSEINELRKEKAELNEKLTELSESVKEAAKQNMKVNELEKLVTGLKQKLEDAHTLPNTVTAQQSVLMELARILMEQAGIDKAILDKWGNKDKAGTLMGILLEIRSSTCKTYLSDPNMNFQYHETIVKEINNILKSLEVDFKL